MIIADDNYANLFSKIVRNSLQLLGQGLDLGIPCRKLNTSKQ